MLSFYGSDLDDLGVNAGQSEGVVQVSGVRYSVT